MTYVVNYDDDVCVGDVMDKVRSEATMSKKSNRTIEEMEEKRATLLQSIAEKQKAFEDSIAADIAEANKLKKEAEDLAYQEQLDFIAFLRKNREVVLKLFKHGRTSCSDDAPVNDWYSDNHGNLRCRCNKCGLMAFIDGKETLPKGMKIEFDISFYYS